MIRYVLALILPILCIGLLLFVGNRQQPAQQTAAYGPVVNIGDIFGPR